MSAQLDTAAEILKFGRLLGLPDGELTYLEGIDAAELRELRESVTDSIFDAGGQMFARLGKATKLLPSALVATIAERSFGPLLCARAAAAVDPPKAIDVATRLSPSFLADATIELDPRRVAQIISGVPATLVVPVAAELGRRHEHVTMGRFLAFVPDAAISAAMGALSDEAMLRTAFVLEHKDALDHAVQLLPTDRLPGVMRCASEQGLWPEALDLLDHLAPSTRGPIADVVACLDEESISGLVAAVSAANLWESLLPVVGTMSVDSRLVIASRPAFHHPDILAEILAAAAHGGFWSDLLPLIDALPPAIRGYAADMVATMEPSAVAALITCVNEGDLWSSLLPIVVVMKEESRVGLVVMPCFHHPDVLRNVVESSARTGQWLQLVPLLNALPETAITQLPAIVSGLDRPVLMAMLSQASQAAASLIPVIDILARMSLPQRQAVIDVIDQADRSLGEALVRALSDPDHIKLLLDHAPEDLVAAVERAATRLDLDKEFTAAITGAQR